MPALFAFGQCQVLIVVHDRMTPHERLFAFFRREHVQAMLKSLSASHQCVVDLPHHRFAVRLGCFCCCALCLAQITSSGWCTFKPFARSLPTTMILLDVSITNHTRVEGCIWCLFIKKKRRSQEIRGQNSVNKELLEIVGSGKTKGSVLKETLAVSVTISISVQKTTQPNPSPSSSARQNERNASQT